MRRHGWRAFGRRVWGGGRCVYVGRRLSVFWWRRWRIEVWRVRGIVASVTVGPLEVQWFESWWLDPES